MRNSKQRRQKNSQPAPDNRRYNKNSLQISDNAGLKLKAISPMTFNQARVFRDWEAGKHIVMHGYAGVGKTFQAMFLALQSIQEYEYKRLVIVRSAVPSRDMGHMPGDLKEKAAMYEAPYVGICTELYGRGDAYQILKAKGVIDFQTTSYLRGITLEDCIILVDEPQNMSFAEGNTILSRVGNNCRIVMCGDYRQSDLTNSREKEGFAEITRRLKRMDEISFIDFQVEDIVRSGFCKSWILSEFD